MARSEVVVFLDAHCECNVGWLEPLLYSLKQDPHKVVSPYIDTIRAESLEYRQSPPRLQGGFNWRLEFSWRAATTVGLETDPIRTPIISGGLFAVTKDFFLKMGGYDPQLNIWGGENFELSFKTWMCGGGLEILPCSRVGHVFRASLPYSFTPGPSDSSNVREDTVLTNLARVATVWMDQYADIFFAAVNFPSHLEVGDIHERAKLREKLHCKSFDWYLQQTFPELQIVSNDTLFHGQVKNSGSLMCLDVISSPSAGFSLGLTACHGGINQTFHLTADHRLRRGEACVTPGVNKTLSLAPCLSPVTWSYQNGTLQLDHTDLCLTSVDNELARLLPCRKATLDDEANIANETHSEPNIRANSKGSYIRDRGLLSTSKLETFRNDDAFQHWKFDYSFNWKRKKRKG
ncbi:hypothetical protein PoB_000893300 [Plakobranchus ocellatus]|uniref:Polypeptide N-acetylgalactosaminyltransferase n=1 Tax=Plakobranchus ocellatus TaxID=259542 RepID=A0AAV3YIT3_9GAST|nr:hypothetical protein PoB_000893300 [Plakobranchus ocellatus]